MNFFCRYRREGPASITRLGQREAWPFLLYYLPMTENGDLWVEVRDQDIVVTMPGASLRVVYRKPHRGSQLVPRLDYFQDQQKARSRERSFWLVP
jgi:hypothetical protein